MTPETWWGLGSVFVGGAFPWLEAVFVIPAGILAGLPVAAVIVAGATGNLLTVGLAAFAGEWIKDRWSAWRRRRKPTPAAAAEPSHEHKPGKQRARIERLMRRGGLPLLALVGPIGLGTQISAVVAVAGGARAAQSFIWIGAGTVLWCVVAAVVATTGVEILGIGG